MRKLAKNLSTEELDNSMLNTFPDLRGKKYHLEYTDGVWIEDEDDWECMTSSVKPSDFTNGVLDIQVVIDSESEAARLSKAQPYLPGVGKPPVTNCHTKLKKRPPLPRQPPILQQPPLKKKKTSHSLPNGLNYVVLGYFKKPDETCSKKFGQLPWNGKTKPAPTEATCRSMKDGNWRGALNEFINRDKRVFSTIKLDFTFKTQEQKAGNIVRFLCRGEALCRGVFYVGLSLSYTKKFARQGAAKAVLMAIGGIADDFLVVSEKSSGGISNTTDESFFTGENYWEEVDTAFKLIKDTRKSFSSFQDKKLFAKRPPTKRKRSKRKKSKRGDYSDTKNDPSKTGGCFKRSDPTADLFPNRRGGYGKGFESNYGMGFGRSRSGYGRGWNRFYRGRWSTFGRGKHSSSNWPAATSQGQYSSTMVRNSHNTKRGAHQGDNQQMKSQQNDSKMVLIKVFDEKRSLKTENENIDKPQCLSSSTLSSQKNKIEITSTSKTPALQHSKVNTPVQSAISPRNQVLQSDRLQKSDASNVPNTSSNSPAVNPNQAANHSTGSFSSQTQRLPPSNVKVEQFDKPIAHKQQPDNTKQQPHPRKTVNNDPAQQYFNTNSIPMVSQSPVQNHQNVLHQEGHYQNQQFVGQYNQTHNTYNQVQYTGQQQLVHHPPNQMYSQPPVEPQLVYPYCPQGYPATVFTAYNAQNHLQYPQPPPSATSGVNNYSNHPSNEDKAMYKSPVSFVGSEGSNAAAQNRSLNGVVLQHGTHNQG